MINNISRGFNVSVARTVLRVPNSRELLVSGLGPAVRPGASVPLPQSPVLAGALPPPVTVARPRVARRDYLLRRPDGVD